MTHPFPCGFDPLEAARWEAATKPTPPTDNYTCPECGATDSTRCAFKINERTGTLFIVAQAPARQLGCRVMHYADKKPT